MEGITLTACHLLPVEWYKGEATAIPSGILWMAIAMVSGIPNSTPGL